MYKGFYGLAESPFSIAPNPAFLFLSGRHREALAHLTYGLGENGGFVLLTGEVGTGKTTVSRSLLKQLPENTDTAFILNPALTELELLATLCDELAIPYDPAPTLKQLTDKISAFLLANHQAGRNTVMIIDEAQHLKPEVLEQLRLLTNLETDTRKLLQVILIGQPELQELLQRRELRQLAQRITARYHLLPLTKEEVSHYVQHRLQVAGRAQPLFKSAAIRALHQYSGGVPRVINLLCERALMGGYAHQKIYLGRREVEAAAAEVLGIKAKAKGRWPWMAGALAAGLAGAAVVYALAPKPAPQPLAEAPPMPRLNRFDDDLQAYQALLHHWGQPVPANAPCDYALTRQLACLDGVSSWQQLLAMDYPAVVSLRGEEGSLFYGALLARGRDGDARLTLQFGDQWISVSKSWFINHFDGHYSLIWQPVGQLPRLVGEGSAQGQVQWLENTLSRLQQRPARMLQSYDSQLRQQVMQFQRRFGLEVDGIAGRQTLELLSLMSSEQGPRLSQGGEA
ncbi:AAA family ATPase [Ferrimonas sediminicola]|uniref:AAA family ATPase n=1 Tax=Ferrimonas sediminicola TaxID=2569538 RepID=A0A4U1BMU4_9GAMM|nr:ExeA family protein [Ferrimonas sediminicola]TKB51438.1 AAA family ATPase [Ferrimonas sediminicola]